MVETLKDLEKRIVTLCDESESEDNRLAMRKTITEIHELQRYAKNRKEYNETRRVLNASRGLLSQRYRDFVSLEFVPPPKKLEY